MKKWWRKFREDNRGIGVVEIILILVILIALVIIFREQLSDIVSNVLGTITKNSKDIMNTTVTPSVTM